MPTRAGYPTELVVHAQRDTTTPYINGVAMAHALHDSLLTVRDDGTHGQFGVNPCANDKVNRYLIDGTLPGLQAECGPPSSTGQNWPQ